MATRSSIFPSLNEDRIYFAEDFLARPDRDHLAGTGDGVSREVGNAMEVTETDPASLAVDVDTGACRGNGWRFEIHTAKEEVALDAADPSDDRIDRIIVRFRFDSANRDAILTKLTGTPAGAPSAPSLTRDADTYEISLAQVLVGAGVTSVTDANITDERGEESLCGWLRAQDSKLLQGMTPEELGAGIAGVESLDHDDLPKTLTAADNGKLFVIDLSAATGDETITLPAEATAGDGWSVRIRLTELSSGNKLIVEDDGSTAQWEMSVPGQLIRPVTDGTSWFNAQPGGILADTWLTASATHTYAVGAVVADVDVTAGGGGGGAGSESNDRAGGGGGGGETRKLRISGLGASDSVTIGTGGTGGTSAGDGSDGGASSWGAFATANGGSAGRSFASEGGDGGAGGSGGQGLNGQGGSAGQGLEQGRSGAGGTSFFGGGGKGVGPGSAGANGSQGGGGSGGGENDQNGGDGGDGIAHVVEYA